jgi:hypothetical protein
MILPIALGILFSMLYLAETLGYSIREAGRICGATAMGYSLHTQFGTLARMSTLVAMPIIGYLLDKNTPVDTIILIPITTSLIYCAVMVLAIKKSFETKVVRVSFSNRVRYLALASYISFFIVLLGVFSAMVLAAVYHENRAMIMQSTVVLTSLGTFISILFFDPMISSIIDRGGDYRSLIKVIFISRIAAMVSMIVVLAVGYRYVRF